MSDLISRSAAIAAVEAKADRCDQCVCILLTEAHDAIAALPADRRWEDLRAWIVARQAKMEKVYEVLDIDILDEWEHADEIKAFDYEDAATEWMESNWTDMDYPETCILAVRIKGTDEVHRVHATAEQTVSFRVWDKGAG